MSFYLCVAGLIIWLGFAFHNIALGDHYTAFWWLVGSMIWIYSIYRAGTKKENDNGTK